MDKNTITGLVLIGALLVAFSFLSRPSSEQLALQKKYYDSISQVQKEQAELKAKTESALEEENEVGAKKDTTSLFHSALQGSESFTTLENSLVKVTIDNKGGRVYSAVLKKYMGQNKKTPVILFDKDDASFCVNFYNKDGAYQTKDYYFVPVNVTDSTVTMRLKNSEQSYIDFNYKLNAKSYLVDFNIQATGMTDKLASTTRYMDISWRERARQQEKGFTYENRLSELMYKRTDHGVDNLSTGSNSAKQLNEPLNWIAFKNQFFSAVLIGNQNFNKAKLNSKLDSEGTGYIKDYKAEMSTFFDPTGKQPTNMYFYFGPNHFRTLKTLDKKYDKDWQLDNLVYLGWPIIRWVNKYFIVYIFDFLQGWGLSMGIILLILTIIVKAVVYPATWKTYMSSAKMRVLKPKVDEIGKKYPKQDDAMKKQQEVMGLYSQYGVSPMGGCLPLLFQFPILMAMFMFVPSSIELRQQSFLWASDLSTYDSFINFGFHIPFLGDHLSLFCVLMTITNLLNTIITTKMQDNGAQPQMAAMKWMMYLMPVMFLFILNDYPAGLNYYYFLSTLISVGTMLMLRETTNDEKLLSILEAHKKDPKQVQKTGFAGRLAAMQKQQEELKKRQEGKR
ncbi:MAG: membrane protein insertase YidC [Bacteroidaceae bacterium]|nr:membrane protein insertase YidC [Bacteroidaceae bacterium]